MDTYTIIPTSSSSADGDPVVLRQSSERRLVFKPKLIDNPNDPDAFLKGEFVFQRKNKDEKWEDHNELPLTKLKATEFVKIELNSSELRMLLLHLGALHRLRLRQGVPRRRMHLLKVGAESGSAPIDGADVEGLIQLGRRLGIDPAKQLLEWAGRLSNASEVVQALGRLDDAAVQRIGSLAGIAALDQAHQEWTCNLEQQDEEYWQKEFGRRSVVLSQVFAHPIVVLKQKAYLGGKGIDNQGGRLVDYLAKNELTGNALLVELKTPSTLLLGSKYRDGVYGASADFSGAIAQALDYRQTLVENNLVLSAQEPKLNSAVSPRCALVIGRLTELDSPVKKRSFELIRSAFRELDVLTFDELLVRIKRLIGALSVAV